MVDDTGLKEATKQESQEGSEQSTVEALEEKFATLFDTDTENTQKNGEKICYTLKIPQGMRLNEAEQAILEDQARELGLSNNLAQKLVEFANRNAQSQQTQYRKKLTDWAEELRQDKELGGDAMQNTLAYAKAGLAKFDPDHKLYDVLQETGYANNPHVIRFLAALGKAHTEDDVLFGNAATAEVPRHERLYGKYNK